MPFNMDMWQKHIFAFWNVFRFQKYVSIVSLEDSVNGIDGQFGFLDLDLVPVF